MHGSEDGRHDDDCCYGQDETERPKQHFGGEYGRIGLHKSRQLENHIRQGPEDTEGDGKGSQAVGQVQRGPVIMPIAGQLPGCQHHPDQGQIGYDTGYQGGEIDHTTSVDDRGGPECRKYDGCQGAHTQPDQTPGGRQGLVSPLTDGQ